ncbi:wound-induced protein 1-like [Mangifera indica]|uniref:wound-induced protein 1-like n=1 Tax=Mangifera indica TaxID=29780 RepID=UPI001CF96642|nr:wound-induced protein 1-like [Mangifera indica]
MCISALEKRLELEEINKRLVTTLYDALNARDVDTVHRLLTPDLEWWFHGPPSHQHLMRILTGSSSDDSCFIFVPHSIVAFGSTVIVEGYNKELSVCWVHAWTVSDGIISQVREYFNTWVTVARFGDTGASPDLSICSYQSVWQSKLCDDKSVPGLVLAL